MGFLHLWPASRPCANLAYWGAPRQRRNAVHDTYYGDYHRWDSTELGYYQRWESETRRPHRDFGRRSAEEQHAYFDWRHKH